MDGATLARAMGNSLSRSAYDGYADDFTRALAQAHCTTVRRAAMFCAQMGHESAGLRYLSEIWGPTAAQRRYEGRRDLGNVHPGDGSRYRGRGIVQVTGRHNYGEFGKWARRVGLVSDPNYFVNNPTVVADPRWAFLTATWYWTDARPQLNALSDAGNVIAATRAINGGTNGLADRQRRWNNCLRIGNALLAGAPSIPHTDKDLDMATLQEVADIVRRYVPSGLVDTVTLPRSPDRVRTATVPVPPRNGVITGNQGTVYASLTCGENAEITEIYAEQDWQADGKRGKKHGLQGRYTLAAGDRQSFTVPGACTQVAVVYRSDADLFLGLEVDTQWK